MKRRVIPIFMHGVKNYYSIAYLQAVSTGLAPIVYKR